ncbi:S1-C subfamily serine protease [Bacillus tianshenii]|uniref:S1-C subfamily serine protease n=1 Tax=Sutcliffiella tianshenii TaxID=1463404 RepID=A0ABS2NX12_9BACI|nr:serine protease [Bacillus tianshenii]MBM7619211.1 S1-C subfamily serine protease [Bacillus tianshenii]
MKREEEEGIERNQDSEEPPLEDFFVNEDDSLRKEEAVKKRKKRVKLLSMVIILALSVNVWGIFPELFNLPSIQFLLKSKELSNDKKIEEWKKAVVTINGNGRKGTGFNIDPSGKIVTNSHVVDEMASIRVSFPDGQIFSANVISDNPDFDFALLEIDGEALPSLDLNRATDQEEAGKQIYIIGNPLSHSNIVMEGETAGIYEGNLQIPVLLLDAPIHSGNSGSPVINENGKVIGVVYATIDQIKDNQRFGLAIPIKNIIQELDLD